MNDPFNPQSGYEPPKTSGKYLKFEKGDTEFLPLASAIIGWEYWNAENKPVRLKEAPENPATLPGIRAEVDENGSPRYRVNHFWAFPVIDVADGQIKVLEITQKSVQQSILGYVRNQKWGSPVMKYTITVNRSGDKFETKYQVMANPTPTIPEEWTKAWEEQQEFGFDINELFSGGDPFSPAKKRDEELEVEPEEDNAEPPN